DNVEQVRGVGSGSVIYKVKNTSSTVDGMAAEPFALAAKNPLTSVAAPKPTVTLGLERSSSRRDADLTVTETIHNPSAEITGSSATASLVLPAGVTVASGGSTTWSPGSGTLAAAATVSHQWTVSGNADGMYQLTATAQDTAYDETFATSDNASLRIDSTAPTPSISCPANGTNPVLPITWSASDASPIGGFDVDVSTNGGNYVSWLAGTNTTSSTLVGQRGSSYQFRARASDALGNRSSYVSCGPVAIGFLPVPPSGPLAPIHLLPAPPHLKLAALRVRRGRLTIQGRLASNATGWITCSYTTRGRHPVRRRTQVAHGRYRLSLRVRGAHTRGVVRIQYSGDRNFAPQRISRRLK
ncbi:MAG TPA: hypothetical protein VH817_18920, partial [Thermoleophilaceae bacterium]